MFRNYFKTTVRNFLRNKVYSLINITGLALGLTCAMLIVLYTKDELSYDRFHKNARDIYRITARRINPDGSVWLNTGSTGYLHGPRFMATIPEVQSFVRLGKGHRDLKVKTEVVSKEFMFADSNFLTMFSFPLVAGDAKTALLNPNSVIVSEKAAIEQFGTADAIGKTMLFRKGNEFVPLIVTAVSRNCPQNSSLKFDLLMPMIVSGADMGNTENWLNFHLQTFLLLVPGANQQLVEGKMKKVFEEEAGATQKMLAEKYSDKSRTVHDLQPLLQLHLDAQRRDNIISDPSKPMYSYILIGIAVFILAIACINFINLTIARSVKRSKEIGIRKVIGGKKHQLIAQFLGESFLLCLAAFVLAIALVQLIIPTFNQLSSKALSVNYLFDTNLVIGYAGLLILTALLAGLYPALILSGFNPVSVLYNRFNLAGKNYLQKSLVVFQFSLATLLIIASLVIYSQFNFLVTKDLGYDDTNIIMVDKKGLNQQEAKLFREELMKNQTITDVAVKNWGRSGTNAKVNGDQKIGFDFETIDENYLPLHKIPFIAGRNFSSMFPADSTQSVLVNETFVRNAGWKDPIGKKVDFGEKGIYSVVGVIRNFHFRALNEKVGPQLFVQKSPQGYGIVFVKIRPGAQVASLEHIETTFKKLYPLNPFSYKFRDEDNRLKYESEQKWKQMLLFGGILTIFISCIGLFGLSVFVAEKRTREIGIRKVFGASVPRIVSILSKDFLKLVAVSLVFAMPLGWYLTNKWLENYAYRISLSWWIFALAGLLVLFVAVATVSFQAIRSAVMNPARSSRV